jgi:membrane-anchored protein YejM (alkaline phosphatase superfamily)
MELLKMSFRERARLLHHYYLASYVVVLVLCRGFLNGNALHSMGTAVFTAVVYLSYGFVYLLPAVVLTTVVHWGLSGWHRERDLTGWVLWLLYAVAVLSTATTTILIYADRTVYSLFGFHLNGFVWNLATTPGGIESMGGADSASMTYGAIILGLVVLQAILLWGTKRYTAARRVRGDRPLRPLYRYAITLFVVMVTGQSVAYGVSHLQNRVAVLTTASAFPFYQPLTFRKLARRLGYEVQREPQLKVKLEAGTLNYPLAPLQVVKPEHPLNIVWLVAESWGGKMLDPEIMPATWAFAAQAHRFTQHYSGGNGTRMGLFSMFYGLYGSYWFQFLDERRSPVIMDVLQEQGYQLSLYTSAKFSYPEFDQTLFARVPSTSLHDLDEGAGWQRDRQNVSDMMAFIKGRDPSRPFMTFLFFESPHARYYFPPESVIREPYLADFNYATMDLARDIDLIHNRYINSCHHLDSQFARLLTFLQEERLLDDTIVVMTGDHGEEFMEKGHWGHNSEFTEEQTRVPLVLWIPGTGSGVVDRMTSHLDIPATILPYLGVQNPAADYSLGYDLLSGPGRDYTVISDWSRIGYVDSEYKAIFPLKNSVLIQNQFTTKNDQPLDAPAEFYAHHQSTLFDVMKEVSRFTKHPG